MIRMKRSKPRTSATPMRTRKVTLRFCDDKNAAGVFLRPVEAVDCDYSEGILQTLPEWEYMLDESGNRFNCNIANTNT